jgi:hypothetical protein
MVDSPFDVMQTPLERPDARPIVEREYEKRRETIAPG